MTGADYGVVTFATTMAFTLPNLERIMAGDYVNLSKPSKMRKNVQCSSNRRHEERQAQQDQLLASPVCSVGGFTGVTSGAAGPSAGAAGIPIHPRRQGFNPLAAPQQLLTLPLAISGPFSSPASPSSGIVMLLFCGAATLANRLQPSRWSCWTFRCRAVSISYDFPANVDDDFPANVDDYPLVWSVPAVASAPWTMLVELVNLTMFSRQLRYSAYGGDAGGSGYGYAAQQYQQPSAAQGQSAYASQQPQQASGYGGSY
ncbi:hypothetical protein DM01DRAFT_1375305 [Hesseltinella vesiculosa]|uniref:Uncharacterized protein n=1 Tax=Hesseltinella vesiculosa TaxID=101127 RepID=A0A1X2GDS8_9FUNG|nr:hypothetical protein DM01DRAFT_1375305 [Hesseltinella vesiculosa]